MRLLLSFLLLLVTLHSPVGAATSPSDLAEEDAEENRLRFEYNVMRSKVVEEKNGLLVRCNVPSCRFTVKKEEWEWAMLKHLKSKHPQVFSRLPPFDGIESAR